MKIFILFFSSLFLITSCPREKKNDNCVKYETATIAEVTAPEVGTVNQPIGISIKFNINNGCGKFYELKETGKGNKRQIAVIVKYEGCICTQIAGIETVKYTFTPTSAGTYKLKFITNNNTFITKTIQIN